MFSVIRGYLAILAQPDNFSTDSLDCRGFRRYTQMITDIGTGVDPIETLEGKHRDLPLHRYLISRGNIKKRKQGVDI